MYCKQGNLERGVIQNNIYFEFLLIYFEPIFKKTVEFSKKSVFALNTIRERVIIHERLS